MTDAECLKIEKSTWSYLLRCILDDLAITAYETSDALQYLQKELE